MSSEKKVCSACDNELHKSLFSKTQFKKGQDRRCKKCIETNQPPKKKRRISDFVFVYTGKGNVPESVVRVHFDSSVVQISYKEFSNRKQLKEVILNEGLESIGKSAFSGCKSLQSITLPSTMVEIGNNAFRNCNELKEVVLNEGLEKIGEVAFSDCISLEIISFPSTLNTVSRDAFIRCHSLKRITLPYLSKRLESIVQAGHVEVMIQIDEILGPVERQGNEISISAYAVKIGTTVKGWTKQKYLTQVEQLISYYEMKEATTILFELAVWKVKVDQAGNSVNRDSCRVGVPKLVKDSILQYLFNAEMSMSMPLEKTYTYTGDGCVPKNVVVVHVHSSVVDIRESEFGQCRYLRAIVLNDGLKKIGTQAFTGCCSLQSISFPSTLTEVSESAFENCKSLREVVLNEGLTKIGSATFYNCKSLEHISFPSTLIEIGGYNGPYECVCVNDIDHLIEFGCDCGYEDKLGGAFEGCSMMREVVFNEGLQKIGDEVFKGCSSLTSLTLPSTINVVGTSAFASCTSLKEVVLNEGLRSIGNSAFYNCKSLQSIYFRFGSIWFITFPSTIIEIGISAFARCTSLREVVLNEGLVKIGEGAFSDCNSLQSITLPTTIVEISSRTFVNCNELKKVVLNEGLRSIGRSAFCNCRSLEIISFPSTLTEVGDSAFKSCTSLREVVLNEGLLIINGSAFGECSSLERVALPSTLNETGYYAFCMCKSLKRITLPFISKRLESIVEAGHEEFMSKIDEIRGIVERQGSEIYIPASAIKSIRGVRGKKRDKIIKALPQCLARIKQLISYYEMKEATTILFELAVWKVKIDQAGNSVNRDACRVGVPKLVKDLILQYLIEHGKDKAKRKTRKA